MFFYTSYNENSEKIVARRDGINPDMLMDITVKKLLKGEKTVIFDDVRETALLILSGAMILAYDGKKEEIYRKSPFEGLPFCLHFCKNTRVEATASEDSEFIIQQTDNERHFEPVLYTPGTCGREEAGETQWGGAAKRTIVTVFDLENAPYSNMVMGEVFNAPGRWSSYPPHHHPQPEVYYYMFDKPQGFGACFIGDDVYKIRNGSAAAIPGGLCHQQAAAPCYAMYYCWMIRHLPDDPWNKTRIFDEDHAWMVN
ncbi:MAG: 5-deoxy-glucuronate isomerase [Oscillospiraceae bacterium]|nr:5-deoxy-glucuronate isomerase [Oscillospiraceae bacterium]